MIIIPYSRLFSLNGFIIRCVFIPVNAGTIVLAEENPLAEIVGRAQSGSRDAFDDLISHFEGKVLKTALYLTRNLHDAQDIAQEVYVKIFRNIHACRDLDRIVLHFQLPQSGAKMIWIMDSRFHLE
jgi:hypothetical protein